MADGDEMDERKEDKDPSETYSSNGDENTSDIESIVDECSQEYGALNKTLDQLDACLNTLEERNDDLLSKVKALLADSRQTREELQQERLEKQSKAE
ncbi:UPF0184 protein-like [Gigantopelta aegis]|uniref:UPF0184 protein-like n=1 Tax=Gigantopelta aegis TaxID=1735272 RepID=UPI001B88914A|nr:UPF0184 protein-like [Gigantopelta aegis]